MSVATDESHEILDETWQLVERDEQEEQASQAAVADGVEPPCDQLEDGHVGSSEGAAGTPRADAGSDVEDIDPTGDLPQAGQVVGAEPGLLALTDREDA
eukprot:5135029-Karenia_brevis.AAC.1